MYSGSTSFRAVLEQTWNKLCSRIKLNQVCIITKHPNRSGSLPQSGHMAASLSELSVLSECAKSLSLPLHLELSSILSFWLWLFYFVPYSSFLPNCELAPCSKNRLHLYSWGDFRPLITIVNLHTHTHTCMCPLVLHECGGQDWIYSGLFWTPSF